MADDDALEIAADAVVAAAARAKPFASRAEAELHRDTYVALMRQIQYDRESAKVCEVELVARLVGDCFAKVRNRILAIPPEQAPRLARCKTPSEAQDMLLDCLTEALEALTGDAGFAMPEAAISVNTKAVESLK